MVSSVIKNMGEGYIDTISGYSLIKEQLVTFDKPNEFLGPQKRV